VLLVKRGEVHDPGLGYHCVRHDDQVVGEHLHGRVAPSDVTDVALLAGLKSYIVADLHLAAHEHLDSAKEVLKRWLQREANSKTTYAERSHEWCERNIHCAEEHESSDGPYEATREVHEERA